MNIILLQIPLKTDSISNLIVEEKTLSVIGYPFAQVSALLAKNRTMLKWSQSTLQYINLEVLSNFKSFSLAELEAIPLQRRVDIKFLIPKEKLLFLSNSTFKLFINRCKFIKN